MELKKEKEPGTTEIGLGRERSRIPESMPVGESPRASEQPPEVESWIEKIEKRLSRVPKGAPGPQDDQVVIPPPQNNQPPVTLPVTQAQITAGHQGKVELSLTWLVNWAIRQIKLMGRVGRRVTLSQLPEMKDQPKE